MFRLCIASLFFLLTSASFATEHLAIFSDSQGNTNLNVVTPQFYQFDTVDEPSPNITLDANTRITVNRSGFYQIIYSVNWTTSNNNRRQIRTELRKNGVDPIPTSIAYGYARRQNQAEKATNSATAYIELNANDYIELSYQRDSTVGGNAPSIPGETTIQVAYVSPLVEGSFHPYTPNTYIEIDRDLQSRSPRGLVSDGQFFYVIAEYRVTSGASRPALYRSTNLSYWEPVSDDLGPVFNPPFASSNFVRDMIYTEQGLIIFMQSDNAMYIIDPLTGVATEKISYEGTPVQTAFDTAAVYDGQNIIGLNRRTLTVVNGISTEIQETIDLSENTMITSQIYNNFRDMVYDGENIILVYLPNGEQKEFFVMEGVSNTIAQRFNVPNNLLHQGFASFDGQNLITFENEGATGNKAFFHPGVSEYTGRTNILDLIN